MFQIRVGGLIEARELIAEGWPTRVIRLVPFAEAGETDQSLPNGHLLVNVDDIKQADGSKILPTMAHLKTILAFTADLTDEDRVLVYCFAGVCRSTSIAIAICLQHNMTWRQAFDHIEKIRDFLRPNPVFIRLIDELFDLHGELIEYARKHKAKF